MSFHEAALALLTEEAADPPSLVFYPPLLSVSSGTSMAATVYSLPFPDLASSLPIADRASLVGLCDHDLRAWSAAKADEYRRFALALMSIYNALAPIHRLPFEILSKIFEECWTDRRSLRIGHVCRRWRSVLLNTTGFWANAVASEEFSPSYRSVGYLGASLERSAPRAVELSFSRFWDPISRCIASHTGRAVSLAVTVADDSQLAALWNCLDSGMHQLRTLTITFDLEADPDHRLWTSDPRVEPLSAAGLPRLTRVTAPAVLLSSLTVPSLQHITLENPYGRYSPEGRLPSYEAFCAALAVCAPTLETLVLLDVGPRVDDDAPPSPISLPALRHLRIADTTRRCALLLSRLAFPPTTHITCTNVDNGALCATLPPNLTPVRAAERVEIRGAADATTVHCLAGGAEERLCVGLAGVRRGLRPDDVVRLFRGARVTHLAVAGVDGRDVQGVEFRAFPHLVSADVRGEVAWYVLPSLARPGGSDGTGDADAQAGADGEGGGGGEGEGEERQRQRRSAHGVVCPGLKTLTVDFQFVSGGTATKGDLGSALRDGDVAAVDANLRQRCAVLARVLSKRSQMGGANLTRLEFGCTEQGWSSADSSEHRCVMPGLGPSLGTCTDWVSWRPIVEPLEKWVDGPVVFTGYRFLSAATRPRDQ